MGRGRSHARAAAWILAAACLSAQPVAAAFAAAQTVAAETFSHAAFDSVLRRFVRDGRVDYGGLARDHGALDRYLAAAADTRPDDWPRAEQIAFWVNAYNARVLDGVIRRPGLKSVLDVGKAVGIPTLGFFREQRRTAGEDRTLDDIEHGILRRRFKDARLHFVLNCASTSCPVLPERALTGATLETDLESATRRFLADSTRNRIDPSRGMRLSEIFKWYAKDFQAAAGSVQQFVRRYGLGRQAPRRDLPVSYLKYDWSLNGSW